MTGEQEWMSREIRDPGASWSFGTFGALAEFSRECDEPATIVCGASQSEVVTSRGGIRLDNTLAVRPVAYETTGKDADHWSHAVALCLPDAECAMSGRSVLTEIGPDAAALREEDRGAALFDLGLATLQVNVCVRTSDPELLGILRASAGRSVFDHDNPVIDAIVRLSPHRVFVGRLGRAEVYQPIPAPDAKSPDGPHTHVLPKLLRARRTHSANTPIPDGWVPCAHVYPAHPAKDAFGRQKPFDRAEHERFQNLLRAFGDPDLVALKALAAKAIAAGSGPEALPAPNSRFGRAALRVTLRQIRALDGPSPNLQLWMQTYDRGTDEPANDKETGHA